MTTIYVVYESHADYTVTEFGYFSSRDNAVAFIERQGGCMKEAFDDELVHIAEYTLDKPLRGYSYNEPVR